MAIAISSTNKANKLKLTEYQLTECRSRTVGIFYRTQSSTYSKGGQRPPYLLLAPLVKGGWGDRVAPLVKGGWGDRVAPLVKEGWGDRVAPLVKGGWGDLKLC